MTTEPRSAPDAGLEYLSPEYYDVAYGWYQDDIPFYVELAKGAGGAVLEVACGTGRVLLPILEAGVDASGFDLRPGFLEVLRRKAQAAGLEAHVFQADMRDFTMPRRYALIVVPFRAFLHNLTTEDQLRTLRCCREHLEAGGRLVLDLFHPSFSRLVEPDGRWCLEKTYAHPETGAPLSTWSMSATDRVNQTRHVAMELRESGPRGTTVLHRHAFDLRWIWKAEMELLLRVAGFTRWQVAGGFDGRPLVKDTDLMIWTAWRD